MVALPHMEHLNADNPLQFAGKKARSRKAVITLFCHHLCLINLPEPNKQDNKETAAANM